MTKKENDPWGPGGVHHQIMEYAQESQRDEEEDEDGSDGDESSSDSEVIGLPLDQELFDVLSGRGCDNLSGEQIADRAQQAETLTQQALEQEIPEAALIMFRTAWLLRRGFGTLEGEANSQTD